MKRMTKNSVIALVLMMVLCNGEIVEGNERRNIGIGVILDMGSSVGKMTQTIILMALEDFHEIHDTTVFVPHFRDSNNDNIQAASEAIDLLKNSEVMAIIGPQQSSQADFVIDIGNKAKVPVISPATSPSLSPHKNPYFIRTSQPSSAQAAPIAALIKSFGWREVAFVYEHSDVGAGPIPYLSDSMANISTQVKYQCVLSPSASDDRILEELYNLKTMQTRVFVVHLLPAVASRFFKKAKEAGMMEEGYAWIITDVLTSLLHTLDRTDRDSMQGVLGVKSYIHRSGAIKKFEGIWKRRFCYQHPEEDYDTLEIDMFGIWTYDSTIALATALERIGSATNASFRRQKRPLTDLDSIGTSEMGSRLLPYIRNVRLEGLSGDFRIVDGQLQSWVYQIVNVVGNGEKSIGFWSFRNGITKTSHPRKGYKNDLGAITWPGDSAMKPKGWAIPTNKEPKLRVGVPAKGGFVEVMKADIDHVTKEVKVDGFCIDVFKAVHKMVYDVPYKFVPYEKSNGERAGDYNSLVYEIVLETFDVVVGDVTILANRSKYVDFTLPFTESGVSMIVPVKADGRSNAWIFMGPPETCLWIMIAAFFIYTGFVVWVLEHRVNKEFRGRPHEQVGMIFWFSFSTLVFAHKEKMTSNLSRFVVIVWVFVVLVLTSSYTASLASMLTSQKLEPTITNINDLIKGGHYVGYQEGSYVGDMLIKLGFPADKLRNYTNFSDYVDALSKGSKNNGVSAIVDELPFIRLLQAKHCNKYSIVGPTYKTAGFGFAFPRGSPLVHDFSRAILQVREGQLSNISDKWFGNKKECGKQHGNVQPFERLTFDSFKGLFLIAGVSSTSALVVFLFIFLYGNKEILVSNASFHNKLMEIARTFDEQKDQCSSSRRTTTKPDDAIIEDNIIEGSPSPTISVYHEQEEMFFPEERGLSDIEPASLVQIQ